MARENVTADDYERWANSLRELWDQTDQNYQGHVDPEDEAAFALIDALTEDQIGALGYAFLEYAPGLTERFCGELVAALVEELARRGEGEAVRAVLTVQDLWREEVSVNFGNLPRGLWKWLAENARDLARIASALETIAEEIARIRETLEDDDGQSQKED